MRIVAMANRGGVEEVRRVAETQAQVLRHRADARAVVEGHHHDAEEHHRRYGADPVEVNRCDAVLGAVGGLADDLQRAEVGGDEGKAGDPGGQRASGEEVVEAGLDVALGRESDPQDHDEIGDQDRPVDPVEIQPEHSGGGCTPMPRRR